MPCVQVAFSVEGAPTKALEGFCKKNGLTPEDVSRQADTKGVKYVWATVRQPGQSAAKVGIVQGRLVALADPRRCLPDSTACSLQSMCGVQIEGCDW